MRREGTEEDGKTIHKELEKVPDYFVLGRSMCDHSVRSQYKLTDL